MLTFNLKYALAGAALAIVPVLAAPAHAAPPVTRPVASGEAVLAATPVQYRYYGRRHYGYRPYRPYSGFYYGYRPAPPPVVYYETRPYVIRRPRRWHPDDVARCASQFRSFSVRTGTYVTYEGVEKLCPYLR